MGRGEPEAPRAAFRLALAGVALAAALPYLSTLDAPFVFDDVKLVKENRFLRPGETSLRDVLGFFDVTSRKWSDEEVRPNYRPVRFLSYYLDAQLTRWWFGDHAPGDPPVFFFHLTNVLLHCANAALVFLAVSRILADLRSPSVGVAFWAALVFAFHPLQTEAVTYVSGRRDVLSASFYLLAANAYLRSDRVRGPVLAVALAALFALGYLSKEVVATLPVVLSIAEFARGTPWTRKRAAALGLLAAEAVAFAALTLATPGLVRPAAERDLLSAVLTAPRYALRYLRLALFPYPQSVDYSYDAIPISTGILEPPATLAAAAGLLGLLALGGALCIRRRGRPEGALCGAGILWFFAALAPVLQIIPSAEVFAERFAYLPLAGFAFALAYGLLRAWRIEPVAAHLAGAFLCLLALGLAVRRNRDWEDPLALWTSACRAQPRAARAHIARAHELRNASRLREAAEEYTIGLEIFEKRPEVPLHHGFILQALTFRAEAWARLADEDPELLERGAADYRRVLSLRDVDGTSIDSSPKYAVLRLNLAAILLRQRKLEEARAEYERIVEIGEPAPLVAAAQYYLGKIRLLEGSRRAAADSLRAAYRAIDPSDPLKHRVAVELADVLLAERAHREALDLIEDALASGARPPERFHLLRRKAEALDRLGDLPGAMELLDRTIAENPAYGAALVSLGRIEANLGRFDEAERHLLAVPPGDPQYAEATGELRALRVRRLLDATRAGRVEEPSEDALRILLALRDKGLGHAAREEWIAAHEAFASLLARARAAGERKLEAEALRELAGVEEKMGRHEGARAYLESAVALDPADVQALRRLGDLCLRRFGDRIGARDAYEKYLAALGSSGSPDPKVLVNLAELVRAERPDLAAAHLERAKTAGADPAFVDWKLGYLYAELGRWKDALEAFERYLSSPEAAEERTRAEARAFVRDRVIPALVEN
ncbi:MAG: tetratricopeptide repeat protein [Planctomycetota bacterium]